jgi:hypothetical protein
VRPSMTAAKAGNARKNASKIRRVSFGGTCKR